MKQVTSALLMLILLAGCTTTHRLQDSDTKLMTPHELNQTTALHDVRVILLDGQWMIGRTRFSADFLRVSSSGRVAHLPLDRVHAIEIPNRKRGGRVGTGVGLVVGIGAAALIATSGGGGRAEEPCTLGDCDYFAGTARTVGTVLKIATAVAVVPIAAAIGGFLGRDGGKERIVLNPRSPRLHLPLRMEGASIRKRRVF